MIFCGEKTDQQLHPNNLPFQTHIENHTTQKRHTTTTIMSIGSVTSSTASGRSSPIPSHPISSSDYATSSKKFVTPKLQQGLAMLWRFGKASTIVVATAASLLKRDNYTGFNDRTFWVHATQIAKNHDYRHDRALDLSQTPNTASHEFDMKEESDFTGKNFIQLMRGRRRGKRSERGRRGRGEGVARQKALTNNPGSANEEARAKSERRRGKSAFALPINLELKALHEMMVMFQLVLGGSSPGDDGRDGGESENTLDDGGTAGGTISDAETKVNKILGVDSSEEFQNKLDLIKDGEDGKSNRTGLFEKMRKFAENLGNNICQKYVPVKQGDKIFTNNESDDSSSSEVSVLEKKSNEVVKEEFPGRCSSMLRYIMSYHFAYNLKDWKHHVVDSKKADKEIADLRENTIQAAIQSDLADAKSVTDENEAIKKWPRLAPKTKTEVRNALWNPKYYGDAEFPGIDPEQTGSPESTIFRTRLHSYEKDYLDTILDEKAIVREMQFNFADWLTHILEGMPWIGSLLLEAHHLRTNLSEGTNMDDFVNEFVKGHLTQLTLYDKKKGVYRKSDEMETEALCESYVEVKKQYFRKGMKIETQKVKRDAYMLGETEEQVFFEPAWLSGALDACDSLKDNNGDDKNNNEKITKASKFPLSASLQNFIGVLYFYEKMSERNTKDEHFYRSLHMYYEGSLIRAHDKLYMKDIQELGTIKDRKSEEEQLQKMLNADLGGFFMQLKQGSVSITFPGLQDLKSGISLNDREACGGVLDLRESMKYGFKDQWLDALGKPTNSPKPGDTLKTTPSPECNDNVVGSICKTPEACEEMSGSLVASGLTGILSVNIVEAVAGEFLYTGRISNGVLGFALINTESFKTEEYRQKREHTAHTDRTTDYIDALKTEDPHLKLVDQSGNEITDESRLQDHGKFDDLGRNTNKFVVDEEKNKKLKVPFTVRIPLSTEYLQAYTSWNAMFTTTMSDNHVVMAKLLYPRMLRATVNEPDLWAQERPWSLYMAVSAFWKKSHDKGDFIANVPMFRPEEIPLKCTTTSLGGRIHNDNFVAASQTRNDMLARYRNDGGGAGVGTDKDIQCLPASTCAQGNTCLMGAQCGWHWLSNSVLTKDPCATGQQEIERAAIGSNFRSYPPIVQYWMTMNEQYGAGLIYGDGKGNKQPNNYLEIDKDLSLEEQNHFRMVQFAGVEATCDAETAANSQMVMSPIFTEMRKTVGRTHEYLQHYVTLYNLQEAWPLLKPAADGARMLYQYRNNGELMTFQKLKTNNVGIVAKESWPKFGENFYRASQGYKYMVAKPKKFLKDSIRYVTKPFSMARGNAQKQPEETEEENNNVKDLSNKEITLKNVFNLIETKGEKTKRWFRWYLCCQLCNVYCTRCCDNYIQMTEAGDSDPTRICGRSSEYWLGRCYLSYKTITLKEAFPWRFLYQVPYLLGCWGIYVAQAWKSLCPKRCQAGHYGKQIHEWLSSLGCFGWFDSIMYTDVEHHVLICWLFYIYILATYYFFPWTPGPIITNRYIAVGLLFIVHNFFYFDSFGLS